MSELEKMNHVADALGRLVRERTDERDILRVEVRRLKDEFAQAKRDGAIEALEIVIAMIGASSGQSFVAQADGDPWMVAKIMSDTFIARIQVHMDKAKETPMAASPRDPKLDPQSGDIFRKDGRCAMVHFLDEDRVYYGSPASIGGCQMTIDSFRAQVADAEILTAEQWHEEFPEVIEDGR